MSNEEEFKKHDFLFCLFLGPVVAEAMLLNREEVPVYPIYRDPVSVNSSSFGILFTCYFILF